MRGVKADGWVFGFPLPRLGPAVPPARLDQVTIMVAGFASNGGTGAGTNQMASIINYLGRVDLMPRSHRCDQTLRLNGSGFAGYSSPREGGAINAFMSRVRAIQANNPGLAINTSMTPLKAFGT